MPGYPDSASCASTVSQPTEKYFGKRLKPRKITVVTGFTYQSEDPDKLGLSAEERSECLRSFGLLDRSPNRWSKFEAEITRMNRLAPPNTTYKVAYSNRHGEAEHNVLIKEYQKNIRDASGICNKLLGVARMCTCKTLSRTRAIDSSLTPDGVEEAYQLKERLDAQIREGMPPPEVVFCSDLDRVLTTNEIAYSSEGGVGTTKIQAVDRLQERSYAFMNCHKRSSKSEIRRKHPSVQLEDGFPETDTMFSYVRSENDADFRRRINSVIPDICATSKTFIGLGWHEMVNAQFLRSIGHPPWRLETSDMMVVVLEITGDPHDSGFDSSKGMTWLPQEEWVPLDDVPDVPCEIEDSSLRT